jgi:hypothetical protein
VSSLAWLAVCPDLRDQNKRIKNKSLSLCPDASYPGTPNGALLEQEEVMVLEMDLGSNSNELKDFDFCISR